MNNISGTLITWLFSWVHALTDALFGVLNGKGVGGLLSFLGENWLFIVLVVMLACTAVDFCVWLVRWRPHYAWAGGFRRALSRRRDGMARGASKHSSGRASVVVPEGFSDIDPYGVPGDPYDEYDDEYAFQPAPEPIQYGEYGYPVYEPAGDQPEYAADFDPPSDVDQAAPGYAPPPVWNGGAVYEPLPPIGHPVNPAYQHMPPSRPTPVEPAYAQPPIRSYDAYEPVAPAPAPYTPMTGGSPGSPPPRGIIAKLKRLSIRASDAPLAGLPPPVDKREAFYDPVYPPDYPLIDPQEGDPK